MNRTASLEWHHFAEATALDLELAQFVAARLCAAIDERGQASLAVSGGRTPAGFLRALALQTLDWSKVCITLADERWVPADHADSNARLISDTLLTGAASAARFIPLYNDASSAHAGQAQCDAQLAWLHWPLDVVVLGMGEDGHTASLFPQAPELAHAYSSAGHCVAVTPVTAPHARISLTLSALGSARCMIVHICGAGKRALLESALQGTASLPVRQVLDAAQGEAHIFWAR